MSETELKAKIREVIASHGHPSEIVAAHMHDAATERAVEKVMALVREALEDARAEGETTGYERASDGHYADMEYAAKCSA